MAASSNGDSEEGITGINVTPLVDITLVLLIIFMVTTKMIVQSRSLPLDLPKAASGSEVQTVFSVELYTNGETVVDKNKLTSDEAILNLAKEAHGKNSELRAVIKADAEVKHGRVIHVVDLLKQGGVSKIAFGITPVAPEPGATTPPATSK